MSTFFETEVMGSNPGLVLTNPGHYYNVECSAKLKTSFELNPVSEVKQGIFHFTFLGDLIYVFL